MSDFPEYDMAGFVMVARRSASLASGADFQFLDQRLDRATSVQNVGIELRTFGQEHADAGDFDVGDAGALAIVAHFPLDLDRLAAGLAEEAVDDPSIISTSSSRRQSLTRHCPRTIASIACHTSVAAPTINPTRSEPQDETFVVSPAATFTFFCSRLPYRHRTLGMSFSP